MMILYWGICRTATTHSDLLAGSWDSESNEAISTLIAAVGYQKYSYLDHLYP